MRILCLIACLLLSFPASAAETRTAIFAGGCFWSMQKAFDGIEGITNTIAGYTGGTIANPSYEQVTKGDTGHREAVLVTYDPAVLPYEKLLRIYWQNIDPIDARGQFCDKGYQYTSAIYYNDEAERNVITDLKMLIEADSSRFGDKDIETAIEQAQPFYPAETHHQRYYEKNPLRYKYYRTHCGRDQRLYELWGKPSP